MGRRLARFGMAVLLAGALAASGASAETRVALVIGNGAYANAPKLPNPANDAKAMAAVLKRLGFDVAEGQDLDRAGLERRLRDFGGRAAESDVAVVFYAGHAVQVDGRNYLLPVEAKLATERDLKYEAVPVDFVLEEIQPARRLRVVLLDACRDNPLASRMARSMGTRSTAIGRGLAVVERTAGDTLVAYATSAGSVAEDGKGRNSPFTTAILRHIEEPGLEIRRFFGKVRDTVRTETSGRQEPYVYASLGGEEFFWRAGAESPPAAAPAAPAPTSAPAGPSAEVVFWQSIQDSTRAADFEAYLKQFPKGTFAALARNRLEELKPRPVAAIPPAPAQIAPAPPARAVPPTGSVVDADAAYDRGDYATALNIWKPLAEAGDPDAREGMGRVYRYGRGVPKDEAQATRWFRAAAEQGHARAQVNLGYALEKGLGVAVDLAQAARWYRAAADQGNLIAQTNMGVLHELGRGVATDHAAAMRWYRMAADKGHAPAMRNIGTLYENGKGVPVNLAEAVNWYRRAGDAGHSEALYDLALLYDDGKGVPLDDVEAVRLYRLAADKGYAKAQNNLGAMYENGEGVATDHAEAMRWYRKAADQGHARAAKNIGDLYNSGRGVPKNMVEAARWYKIGADRGDMYAQYEMALKYDDGDGVALDDAAAIRYYRLAADQGNANARNNLGAMYDNGEGVPVNSTEAAKWFRLAADQGHAMAQKNLGQLYEKGRGVPQSNLAAHVWFSLALTRTDTDSVRDQATQGRDRVARLLRPDEVRESARMVREWKPK